MFCLLNTVPKIDIFLHLRPFAWVIPVIIVFYVAKIVFKNPKFKGWLGEKQLDLFTLKKLDPKKYKILSDLYIPRSDDQSTTQIDHLLVSPYGVFVIETKNYGHWIFGSEKQAKWTQKIFKVSKQFQNPLRQNKAHIDALVKFLDADESYFHNLVFFVGNSTFKKEMPHNVKDRGFRSYIESYQNPLLTPEQVDYIYTALSNYDKSLDRKQVAIDHVKFLKMKFD